MEKKTRELVTRLLCNLKPPTDLSLSEWADTYRILSAESNNEPGRWRTSKAPYQKDIMDAITDKRVAKVVVMCAAQMGKTDGFVLNTIGYYMHQEPCPMLTMMPTLSLAEGFSKERIMPMIRDTPVLQGKINPNSKGNTILKKQFAGGFLALIGANSTTSLSSRPIRILLADEVDRFPISTGNEGDPLALAETRLTNFWNRKEVNISTPTIKDVSRIELEYNNSTMHRWMLPCPECGEYQQLKWPQVKIYADDRPLSDYESARDYKDKKITINGAVCMKCGAISSEEAWRSQQKKGLGKYVPLYPDKKIKGFHLNCLVSPWVSWVEVAEKYVKALAEAHIGNIELLIVFTNTVLGECWEDRGEQVDENKIAKRTEFYNCEVPTQVRFLSAGVDVQDDRLELEVVGWGVDKESYGIQYAKFFGNPLEQDLWDRLYSALKTIYTRADGKRLKISCTCIDSGGHYTQEVYKFCEDKESERIFAIKGKGGMGVPFINNPTHNNRMGVQLFTIGVDAGKELVYNRLRVAKPGGGYCHFPLDEDKNYDENYFEMLTAEKKVLVRKNGRPAFAWKLKKEGMRNEALDIRNYATAALEIYNPDLTKDIGDIEYSRRKVKKRGVVSKGI